MNERIKELTEQCTRHRSYWMTIDGELVQLSEHAEVFDKEKFAELIVRECAGVAWGIYANQEIANGIKQHFGVE